MPLALTILVGGLVVFLWIFLWSRERRQSGATVNVEQMLLNVPGATGNDALFVARDHGQLVYINNTARRLMDVSGDAPDLEVLAARTDPADSFLELFASERQASFRVGTRWMQAASHRIPVGTETRTIVTMRELLPAAANGAAQPNALDLSKAMAVINEIGDTLNSSMGTAQTLQALLTIIAKALPADAGEIALWDDEERVLRQQGWIGNTAYLVMLAEAGNVYHPGEGISGWVAKHRRALLVEDRRDPSAVQPKLSANPYQCFASVPLQLGERFFGTLTFLASKPNQFTQADYALLQAVATPAATAIYNADLYAQQTRRVEDIAALQQIAEQQGAQDIKNTSRVYGALTERIARLMNASLCGIMVYDEQRQALVPEQPFYGLTPNLVPNVTLSLNPDTPQRDIWERADEWYSNHLADEPLVLNTNLRLLLNAGTIFNLALVPMPLGDKHFGMVMVCNKRTEGGFTQQNIRHLRVLGSQAAIVVENLKLLQREQQIEAEVVALQRITEAIGTLGTQQGSVIAGVTERIASMMNVEICGVLFFNAETQTLDAQMPFFGVDSARIGSYSINVASGTVMSELIWENDQFWYNNQMQSLLVYEAGLAELSEAVGIRKMMLAVLSAGGKKLGVVQVANKHSGADFTDNDARLLMIFAAQVAAMIENTRLLQKIQRSAETAEMLRRIAELAGSVVTTNEPFTPVLQEIARLSGSPLVFVNVLDQSTASMVTYPRWVYGVELSDPIVQDMFSSDFDLTPAVVGQPVTANDQDAINRLLPPAFGALVEKMNVKRVLVAPLFVGDRSLGEVGVANRESAYEHDDQTLISTIAAQISAAIERLRMYEATGQNLNRRMEELDAISSISNMLTQTIELDRVLDSIRQEVARATGADGSTIALLTPPSRWASDDEPEMLRRVGDTTTGMARLAPIERQAVLRGADTVMVTDYEHHSSLKALPAEARSAIAAPFHYGEQVVGVIHVYHHESNRFDDRAAAFVLTVATKAALAYANDQRYQSQMQSSERLRQRVEQLNQIFELGHMLQTNADPVSVMEAIAFSIHQSVGFGAVVMLLLDDENKVLRRVSQAGLPLDVFERTRNFTMTLDQLNNVLAKHQFRTSESYFFPFEKVAEWLDDGMEALETTFTGNRTLIVFDTEDWHDGDKLVVPLMGTGGSPLGLMVLDRPLNGKRPDRHTVEVLEIFAHQAAYTIENTRLYLSSVRSAEQEARLNEMMEAVSSSLDVNEIVLAVARGALRLLPFHRMSFALLDTEQQSFDVVRVNVALDGNINILTERRVDLENTVLGHVFNSGEDLLFYADDPRVQDYTDLRSLHAHGEQTSLMLPLLAGGVCLGAAHLGSDLKNAYGFQEFRQLVKRMMNLATVAMQNARLFNQAVNLRAQNESVIESIQQGIVVLNNSGHIVSVNDYMRQLYGWDEGAIRRDLFTYSPALGGMVADDVRHVLNTGEPRQRIRQSTVNLVGEATIRSFYTYPLITGDTVRGVVLLVEDETERAQLEQDVEARANQLAALTEVSSRITASLDRSEVVELALEETDRVIGYDTMTLWRRNGSFMVLEGIRGKAAEEARPEELRVRLNENERINRVVEQQRVVIIPRTASGVGADALLPGDAGAQSWMGVPLINQGHVVGMLILTKAEADYYDTKAEQAALAFANQVAVALANADLFEQTFARTNELGMLLEAAQATSLTLDLDEVFNTVVELMLNTLDMDDCAILTWDKVANALEVQIDVNRTGDPDRISPKGKRYDLTRYPARRFALTERQVVVIRSDDDTAEPTELEELRRHGGAARMLVPLVVRDEARGLIQVEQAASGKPLTQQQIRLARALGSQVAVAIENARLSAETAERFEELYVINELSRAISSTLQLDDVIAIVRDQLPQVTGVRELYLALFDEQTQEITFPLAVRDGTTYNIAPRHLGTDEVSYVIRKKQMLILVEDMLSLDDIRRNIRITNGEGDIKSYMGVPLISGDQVLGVLAVRSHDSRAFGVNDQGILTTVAAQLGAAIQNARLFEQVRNFAADLNRLVEARTFELEQERDRIDTLYQITSELSRTLDMDRVVERALGMVSKAVNADDGVIFMFDPMTDSLYSRASLNPTHLLPSPDGGRPRHPAEPVAVWLMENDHDVVLDDLTTADWWDASLPGAESWRSALAVLLETNEDVQGVMVFVSQDKGVFAEPQLKLVVAAANQVAAAINNSDLYQLIRDQAERLGTIVRAEQEEAEKNAAILESIADGVMLTDANGIVVLFNTSAERILDLPRDEVIGQPVNKLTGLYGGSSNFWTESVEEWRGNPERYRGADFLDERLELGERVVSVHLSPVYIQTSTGPNFLGTVSVFRDITKDVEVDRVKSEFISNVSHEFRTPMTSIKGYADLLLLGAGGEVDEVQKRFLMTIKENADRLSVLVNDVLEISKIDSGRDKLNIEPVDVQTLVDQVVANVQQRMEARKKQLDLLVRIAPDMGTLHADRDKLLRVLINIADNAFNYTYAGGSIEIRVEPEGLDRILFAVTDTGIGIPDEFKPRVWRRFERFEEHALVMDVAGTGLGLSIVKDLVEMHHGRIWFESELNKGTTFFVSLPLHQPVTPLRTTSETKSVL